MGEEKLYEIVITKAAMIQYQDRVLPYLYDNFSFERASEIDEKIINKVNTLSTHPLRGRLEAYLSSFKQDFRFILYKENKNFEIKIIYFLAEKGFTVYVTDFFPTKMNPQKMID
jgi:hypothetical protein